MVSRPVRHPTAVVIGPPGSGKTTIASLLAERLGEPFTDTDHVVESVAGQSISDIFLNQGEATFREMERTAVASSVTGQAGVIALGGGAPMDPHTRDLLTRETVVFLDVGIADAARRIGLDASRPLLAVNPRASWIAMMKERRPVYESLATIRVDTAGRKPAEIVDEIVQRLQETR